MTETSPLDPEREYYWGLVRPLPNEKRSLLSSLASQSPRIRCFGVTMVAKHFARDREAIIDVVRVIRESEPAQRPPLTGLLQRNNVVDSKTARLIESNESPSPEDIDLTVGDLLESPSPGDEFKIYFEGQEDRQPKYLGYWRIALLFDMMLNHQSPISTSPNVFLDPDDEDYDRALDIRPFLGLPQPLLEAWFVFDKLLVSDSDIPDLVSATRSRKSDVRILGVVALSRLSGESSQAAAALRTVLVDDRRPVVQALAALGLAQHGHLDDELLPIFADQLDRGSRVLRRVAENILGRYEGRARWALDSLETRLTTQTDAHELVSIIDALAQIEVGPPRIRDRLLGLLHHDSYEVRTASVRALVAIGEGEADQFQELGSTMITHLHQLLDERRTKECPDHEGDLVDLLAHIAGAHGGAEAERALERLRESGRTPTERKTAIELLTALRRSGRR